MNVKREIYHHVSVIIVRPTSSGHLLLGVYDSTYPLETYRERVNFFGGNQHPEDQSPLGLLTREIYEEFCIHRVREDGIESSLHATSGRGQGAPVPKEFAPAEDIQNIRDALLSSCKPYKDFFITAPRRYVKDQTPRIAAITSAFEGSLDESLFECAREHLAHGKAIKSEGFATIVSIDDLVRGRVLSAGGSPVILADYLQTSVPDPYGLVGTVLGAPRNSLAEYEDHFRYLNVKRNPLA